MSWPWQTFLEAGGYRRAQIGVIIMNENHWREDLKERLKVFGKQAASVLIDCLFLALWLVLQWLVEAMATNLEPSGIDKKILLAFQIVFAISTLAPIVVYIYTDIRVMVLRARRRIQAEENSRRTNDADKQ